MLTRKKKRELIKATLDWCNEIRVGKGEKPLRHLPKGEKGNPRECPCGKATGLRVYSVTAFSDKGFDPGTLIPKEVQEFVEAFDRGLIPEKVEV